MPRTSIVLTASRFGGSYFLDVLGQARPGDLVLQDIFQPGGASLPQLSVFLGLEKDVIAEMAGADPTGLWARIRAASDRELRHAIAKVYYYHLPRESDAWSELAGSRVVHMLRRNLLDAYLSKVQAEHHKVWQTNDSDRVEAMNRPVSVDPKAAQRFIAERQEQIRWARRRFSAADYHEVFYEDVAAGPMRCKRVVREIFGVDMGDRAGEVIRPGRDRIKRNSNADVIANYSEVAYLDRAYL